MADHLTLNATMECEDKTPVLMGESCPVSPMVMTQPVSPAQPMEAPWAATSEAPIVVEAAAAPAKRVPRASAASMRVWEYEEDQILLAAVAKYGKRWRAIARLFSDRTEAMCRNRYTRIFAPHRPEMKGWKPCVNRCNACGQYKKGHSCSAKGKLFVGAEVPTAFGNTGAPVPAAQLAPLRPLAPLAPLETAPAPASAVASTFRHQQYQQYQQVAEPMLMIPSPSKSMGMDHLVVSAGTMAPNIPSPGEDRRIPLADLLSRLGDSSFGGADLSFGDACSSVAGGA
mmetsp:Transcript_27567/g.70243  ORF Transcript_27567/g.70243 Transcript_27567/m.70243 type:complete len:285 (+) Transcript_27567:369-1223(+)